MLVAAFALSLLVHAILAFFLHPPSPSSSGPLEPIRRIQIEQIARVTPSPPPRPIPRRTSAIVAPHVVSVSPSHAPQAVTSPAVVPTAAPTPAPTPRPAGGCIAPDAPASIAVVATPPAMPADVRALDIAATAIVAVQLDATGAVTSATVELSTNDAAFDALSIAMARGTQYSPARHACKPIASSYRFRVQWAPW